MPNFVAKFYKRSFIDQDLDGYTLTGDFVPLTNINDRRKDTYAITSGFNHDGEIAQVWRIQISSHSAGTFTVTINGEACAYISDGTPTHKEIIEGIYAAIVGSSQPVTPTYTNPDHTASDCDILVTANTEGVPFVMTATNNLTVYEEVANLSNPEFIADMLTDRYVHTIFLKSNFLSFKIYKWASGNWSEVYTTTNNDKEFLPILIRATTDKIKIVPSATMEADEEKIIYLAEIVDQIYENLNLEKIEITQNYTRNKFENLYGGSVQIVDYPNRGKVNIILTWENMSASDYENYSLLKTFGLADSYFVYLYFSDDYALLGEEALYLVNDIENIVASPASETIAAGVSAKMHLLEC